jgi:hypothetical protein
MARTKITERNNDTVGIFDLWSYTQKYYSLSLIYWCTSNILQTLIIYIIIGPPKFWGMIPSHTQHMGVGQIWVSDK